MKKFLISPSYRIEKILVSLGASSMFLNRFCSQRAKMDVSRFVSVNLNTSYIFQKDFYVSNKKKFLGLAKYNIIKKIR